MVGLMFVRLPGGAKFSNPTTCADAVAAQKANTAIAASPSLGVLMMRVPKNARGSSQCRFIPAGRLGKRQTATCANRRGLSQMPITQRARHWRKPSLDATQDPTREDRNDARDAVR